MDFDIVEAYQELTDLIITFLPDQWASFKLTGRYSDSGLGISLEYANESQIENEISPVPTNIFRVMKRIRDLAGSNQAWSEWIFDYHRSGKYDISVKYPDSPRN